MNEFLLIASMAIATMVTRIPALVTLSRRKLPAGVERALRYVPPAVLAAIIAPMALLREGQLQLSLENASLGASLVAVLVAWRTRSLLLTIVLGMVAFLLWRAILS